MRPKVLALLLFAVALAHVPGAAADDIPPAAKCVTTYLLEGGINNGPFVCWGHLSCHGGCEPVDGPGLLP